MLKQRTLYFTLILGLLVGCTQPEPLPPTSAPIAKQRLIDLLHDDYKIENFTVRSAGKTVWVYIPFDESFYDMAANNKGVSTGDVNVKQEIKFIDGTFIDKTIKIDYDIDKTRAYAKSQGYQYKAAERFRKLQSFIPGAIKRAYPPQSAQDKLIPGDRKLDDPFQNKTHEDLVRSKIELEDYPEFFIVVYADIKNGLETRNIFNLADYHRANIDQGFMEEYVKRSIQVPLYGDPNIVGDTTGENHIEFKELTWPEFILKQILYRINFKYSTSAFPPTEDPIKELLEQAALTVKAYDFEEFESIQLNDLRTNKEFTLQKYNLSEYYPDEKPAGKLHTISFDASGGIKDVTIENQEEE